MPTTSNFGWTTPADTDLVKDGAAAIRTLGNGIDTSFLDLKGGTTDQVLAKNSNTDLDFKWVAQDDSNAIQNAIVDAKGDLIAASAADTPARLAVGTNGQYLQADSTAATGLAWATLPASGKVLQVVQGSTTTETANTTSTYADSTLTASITPSLATSKVLVLVTQQGVSRNSGSNECILNVRIVRGATTILTQNRANHALGGTGLWLSTMVAMAYLDSPNTTSSTTYKTQFAIGAVGSHTYTQYDSSPSYITLIEIGA